MLKPSHDPLKNRRFLAMLAAFHAVFVFPYIVVIFNKWLGISDAVCDSLLVYMEGLTAMPILGYLYGAYKQRDCGFDGIQYGGAAGRGKGPSLEGDSYL